MPSDQVKKFIEALHAVEADGDVEQMVEQFEPEATLNNSAAARTFTGRDGAEAFWRSYRSSFDEIHSEFTRIFESGALAALEWTARGKLHGGGGVHYDGVTLLELGAEGIKAFRSYFNPLDLPRTRVRDGDSDPVAESGSNADAPDGAPTDLSYGSPGHNP